LYVYRLENGRLPPDTAFRKDTLSEPNKIGPQQLAGTVHVHPNGRFVYVANHYRRHGGFQRQEGFCSGLPGSTLTGTTMFI
jgi:hypothetical protein